MPICTSLHYRKYLIPYLPRKVPYTHKHHHILVMQAYRPRRMLFFLLNNEVQSSLISKDLFQFHILFEISYCPIEMPAIYHILLEKI